jgi:hypothetical protein
MKLAAASVYGIDVFVEIVVFWMFFYVMFD